MAYEIYFKDKTNHYCVNTYRFKLKGEDFDRCAYRIFDLGTGDVEDRSASCELVNPITLTKVEEKNIYDCPKIEEFDYYHKKNKNDIWKDEE